jgi:hypothetical protein
MNCKCEGLCRFCARAPFFTLALSKVKQGPPSLHGVDLKQNQVGILASGACMYPWATKVAASATLGADGYRC